MQNLAILRGARRLATALPALLASVAPLPAQAPADAIFRDFVPVGEFVFELGGKDLENAEIYASDRAAAYLVMAPELSSPVLVNPRTQSAEAVHLMKVARQSDGSVDLLADATFNRLSGLRIEGTEVHFEVKGETAKLKPKPPLLGFQSADSLKSHDPQYARLADDYSPSASSLQVLRSIGSEAEVVIYFGTWCPTCSRLVPRVLRIADELRDSNVGFRYYGLPRDIDSDAAARRDDIHGVPTGIVYVGGKAVGRLEARDLNVPEASLARMLNGR